MNLIQLWLAILITFLGGEKPTQVSKPDCINCSIGIEIPIDIVDIDRHAKDDDYKFR